MRTTTVRPAIENSMVALAERWGVTINAMPRDEEPPLGVTVMAYKGEDLDLRTPPSFRATIDHDSVEQAANGTHRAPNGSASPGQNHPDATIWVDELLLACCNHAFDVAFAHRAEQVRIEHLLYAITRVDSASEVLEANGVRDAGLRRESAMVIATAIPVATTGNSARPQGSLAVKEALQLASTHAASFNRAAGIRDLLHVFTAVRPDLPGLDLLRRHMNQGPPLEPGSYTPPFDLEPPQVKHQVVSAPTIPAPMKNSTTDILQDNRLEALEQMVRALGRDLEIERRANAGALNRTEPAPVYAPAPPSHQTYSTPAPSAPAPAPVPTTATDDLGNAFGPRIDRMESGLAAKLDQVSQVLSRLDGRLTNLEQNLGQQGPHDDTAIQSRLSNLEDLIKTQTTGMIDLGPLDTRLNDIEVALLSQDASSGASETIGESIEDLRENFAHSMDNVRHILNERIDKLHENTSVQFSALHNELGNGQTANEEAGAAISAELKALAGAQATHAASAERNLAGIREALSGFTEKLKKLESENLETRGNFVDELREVHDAIMKLNTNQHTLADSISNWHNDHVRDLDAISSRLAVIDTNTSRPLAEIQRVSKSITGLESNMDAMYRATIERYHRRNRFWFWLLGTDDWVGASWPSQTARIEDELRALKTMHNND